MGSGAIIVEQVPLVEHEDVTPALLGQVVSSAGTDNAGADDDETGIGSHRLFFFVVLAALSAAEIRLSTILQLKQRIAHQNRFLPVETRQLVRAAVQR